MDDRELIRKAIQEAVQEAAEEHDLEKVGGLLRGAIKYGGKGIKAFKTGFQRGKNPQTQEAAEAAAKKKDAAIKVTDKRSSTAAANAAKPNAAPTSLPYKTGQNLKTGVDKIKTAPSRIKANPVGTAKTTAKVAAGTGVAGGIIYGGIKAKEGIAGMGGPGGSGGGDGQGAPGAGAAGGPGANKTISGKQASSRFMGRTGSSGHAPQMRQGYAPTTYKSLDPFVNMFKQYVDNSTVPAMAQSMPATSAEMPMAVLNESYQELMGSNLPPVKLKVDDREAAVEKVTEAVMKQQDEWQSAQQIGAQVVDAMMYNPEMIPGAKKVKGLYDKLKGKVSPDAIKDMKFDESGMPIHPKTGEAMDEKQMAQFYGDVMGSKYAGAQGFGQQVGTPMNQQSTNIPPKPQQQKETNDKPV